MDILTLPARKSREEARRQALARAVSDARWLDVDDDLASAARHFAIAVQLHSKNGFDGYDIDAYRESMALQHALQSGHTAAEAALLRILQMRSACQPNVM